MRLLLATVAAIALASPAAAQMDRNMPGMKMPAKLIAKPKSKRVSRGIPRRSVASPVQTQPAPPTPEHDMSSMPGLREAPAAADPHAGHDVSGMAEMPDMESPDSEIGNARAPTPPANRAADAIFGAAQMADSRKTLRHENGGMPAYSVLFNLAEYRVQKGSDAYRWDGEGWFGGDINRLVVKTEGEGAVRGGVDSAEVQGLYSRAIDPYFNLQAGVRHDFNPGPPRTYATVGFEGIAPYWFHVSGGLFLSDKGDFLGRLEGTYDQRITQKFVLQPRVELNLAAQDVSANGIGAGLSDAELGLRLRYEIKREFAPYVGVSWESKIGATARFARAAGDRVRATSMVIGIRSWF